MSLESDHQPGAEQRKVYLDWQNFGNGLEVLRNQIIDSKKKFTGIYAIPRGGLMIGVYLSHHLGIPMLDQPVDGCLIVDDINDTGKTLSHIVNTNSGKFKIATFHMKSQSIIKSDYYVKLEEPESWIVYPYEV